MKQPKITNSDEIKTSQLLDSLSSLDFNHYNYSISNNELQFVKNPVKERYCGMITLEKLSMIVRIHIFYFSSRLLWLTSF